LQAKVLCPQKTSKERSRFFIGTCSLHEENEINLVDYSEDSNSLQSLQAFSHPDQIVSLDTSSHDSGLIVTSWLNKTGEHGVTLWRIPSLSDVDLGGSEQMMNRAFTSEKEKLLKIASFSIPSSTNSIVKWHTRKDSILTANNTDVSLWSITESEVMCQNKYVYSTNPPNKNLRSLPALAWDPQQSASTFALGIAGTLSLCDARKMEVTESVTAAHDGSIRDIDFNPHKPTILSTCGEDRKVKIWDMRSLARPLKILEGHSHWVCSVKYNPFHDQLLLSGGSDNAVSLWRVASCSSAPWIGGEEASSGARGTYTDKAGGEEGVSSDPPDVKVRHLDQHEDSVYSVAWSMADAWTYASLSFDGRLIVSHVPSTEKYKILL